MTGLDETREFRDGFKSGEPSEAIKQELIDSSSISTRSASFTDFRGAVSEFRARLINEYQWVLGIIRQAEAVGYKRAQRSSVEAYLSVLEGEEGLKKAIRIRNGPQDIFIELTEKQISEIRGYLQ